MKFIYARHSSNLAALEKFYTEIIGLQKLGGFEDHTQKSVLDRKWNHDL
jgi:hypothetical protein